MKNASCHPPNAFRHIYVESTGVQANKKGYLGFRRDTLLSSEKVYQSRPENLWKLSMLMRTLSIWVSWV